MVNDFIVFMVNGSWFMINGSTINYFMVNDFMAFMATYLEFFMVFIVFKPSLFSKDGLIF